MKNPSEKINLEKLERMVKAIKSSFTGIININARNLSSKQYSSESCCIEIKNGIVCGYVIGDELGNEYYTEEDGYTVNWDWDGNARSFNKTTFTSDLGNECSFELLPEFQEQLNTSCIYILADSLAKKGYKHQAVLWCLFNTEQVPDNWELEFVGIPTEITRYETLSNKKELLKLKKYAMLVGVPTIHVVTYSSYGYDEYDFVNMKKYGYVVTCCGSHAFGGNCNCYSHDPGYDYEKSITFYDIPECYKKIENVLSSKYENVSVTI